MHYKSSRYLQQWSILPCTAKSSNWKHRKGSCGGGVGVYYVQPTVQLEAARKGSCGTYSCEELVIPLTCYNPGPNMNATVGTDISVQVVRFTTQDLKVVQQRCQKPQIYETKHFMSSNWPSIQKGHWMLKEPEWAFCLPGQKFWRPTYPVQ